MTKLLSSRTGLSVGSWCQSELSGHRSLLAIFRLHCDWAELVDAGLADRFSQKQGNPTATADSTADATAAIQVVAHHELRIHIGDLSFLQSR